MTKEFMEGAEGLTLHIAAVNKKGKVVTECLLDTPMDIYLSWSTAATESIRELVRIGGGKITVDVYRDDESGDNERKTWRRKDN